MDARPLDVVADVTVTVDGSQVQVRGYGDLVVVDAPDVRTALTMLRGTERFLPFAGRTLDDAAVSLDVRVAGGSVARLGPDVEPNLPSRLAGTEPARLSVGSSLLALLRDR